MACKVTSSALGIDHFVRLCHNEEMFIIQQASEIVSLFNQMRLGRDFSRDTVAQLEWRKCPSFPSSEQEWSASDSLDDDVASCWQGREGVLELRYDNGRAFEAYLKKDGIPSLRISSENIYMQWDKEPSNLIPHLSTDQKGLCLYLFDPTEVDKERVFCDKQEVAFWEEKKLDSAIKALQVYVQASRQRHTYSSDSAKRLEECCNAVCRIVSPDNLGTGFVIGNRLLMTNHHILQSEEICQKSMAEFFYSSGKERVRVEFAPSTFFVTSKSPDTAGIAPLTKDELDFTIVALKPHPKLENVFAHPISLNDREAVQTGKDFHLIHHPSGKSQEVLVAMDPKNRILKVKNLSLIHEAPTDPGSSGSPLISTAMRIMALHRQALGVNPEQKAAVKIESIVYYLKNHVDSHTNESYWARVLKEFKPLEKPSEVSSSSEHNRLNLPVAFPSFTGRQELLDHLEEKCFSNPWNSKRPSLLIHLHGFAGLGKSETAIYFANSHLDKFSLVWRIRCEDAWYEIDYRSLAKSLNIPLEKETLKQVVDKVHANLSMRSLDKPWLLLLDGIEELGEERASFPERGGVVLSTSQTEKLWDEQETVSIEPFNLKETRDFFTNASFEKRITNLEGLESLHEALQGWPILLSNAYTYILDTGGQITDYVQELESIEPLFTREKTSKYPRSLAQAFELTLRRLRNPESMTLLSCCAYLNPKEIPFSIFHEWQGKSPLKWKREVTGPLKELSIIHYQGESFRFHGLWQFFLRQKLKKEGKAETYFEQALQLLTSQIDGLDVRNPKNWAHIKMLLPHLEKLIQDSEQFALSKENRLMVARMSNSLGSWMSDSQGSTKRSLSYLKKSLEIRQALLGEEHLDTAESYNEVGDEYRELGEHDNSLACIQKALEIRQPLLGEEALETAISYNSLGVIYGAKGEHKKSLIYLEKALEIRLRVEGTNAREIAQSYSNVAGSYQKLEDYEKALKYYEKALEIRQDLLGEEHPDIAINYNNMGSCYGSLEKHKEALEYRKKALKIWLVSLGEEHPNIAASYNNIAGNYIKLERYPEAVDCLQKALAISLKILGEEDPRTATMYNSLGSAFGKLGDLQKELEYKQIALKIRQKKPGDKHPITATSYSNVGSVLEDLGNYQEALEHHQKALEIRKKALGEKDPNTAISYVNVASSLEKLKKYSEALPSLQKAFEIRLSVLGNDHHDIARTFENVYELELLQAYLT